MPRSLAACVSGRRLLLAVTYLLVLVSCDNPVSPDGGLVGGIEVAPASLTMEVGVALSVTARVVDASGARLSNARLYWSTENPAIATVSQSGNVVAVASGATRLAVSSRGVSAIVPVTVAALPVAVVRVTPASTKVRAGSSVTLRADAMNSAGDTITGNPVLWTSSNDVVATVSSFGIATGVSPGIASIVASVNGVTGSALVVVEAVPVASVRVLPVSGALFVGQSLQLTAVTEDSAGRPLTGRLVEWTSSAPAVVTVSSTGIVHALASGSATITARSEARSATSVITTSLLPASAVTVAPGSATVAVGQRVQLTARVLDSAGAQLAGRTVSWTSDQPGVATVAQDGQVTAVAVGRATITATSERKTGQATIDVTPTPVATLTVTPSSLTLPVGTTQLVTAVARDAQGAVLPGRVVTWLSGAPTLATVSQSGLVTATGEGTALIIATCEGQQARVSLTVVPAIVTQVSVSPTTATLNPDSSRQFAASARDANGNVLAGRPMSWSSSDRAVATVSASGVVTALAVGTSQLSASTGGITGSALVTVALVPVANVAMSLPTLSLVEAGTSTLSATATDSLGGILTGRTLVWASDNPAVATVTQGGVVAAIAPGRAIVSAAVPNAGVGGTTPSGATAVTVTYAPVTGVSVLPATSSLFAGDSVQLTATLAGAPPLTTLPATGRSLRWSVADPAVASVSSTGVVTGIGAGSTTVILSASSPGQLSPVTATASVSVKLVPISRVVLTPMSGTIHVGTLYARPASAQAVDSAGNVLNGRAIAWTTSDASRISVTPAPSNPGLATLVALNTPATGVLLVATASGPAGPLSDTLTISSDLVAINAVTVSPSAATLLPSDTLSLTAIASDSAGNAIGTTAGNPLGGRLTTWASASPNVGIVSATGVVTAIGLGSTSINASVGGVGPARFALTVALTRVASVALSATDSSIFEGQAVQATAVARDAFNNVVPLAGRAIVWSSTSSAVATVSPTGLVSAVRAGTATIGVTIDGVGPATFTLSVAQVPVARVDVTPTSASPVTGDVTTFAATPRDSVGNVLSNRIINWSTSNAKGSVFPSSGGTTSLTARDSGTVVVSATSEGKPGIATVSIALAPVDTIQSVPSASAPSVRISAGTGNSAREKFRVLDARGLRQVGRQFTVTSGNPALGTAAAAGAITTDSKGEAEFIVTLTSAARAGDAFTVTVAVDGKSTVWQVTVR